MAIRLAMIGCGGIMAKHARAAAQSGEVAVVGLCDVAEANMDKLIAAHFESAGEAPPKFTDPSQMYERTRPEAVVIASPHTLHYAHACEALQRGCHILMEKPMVTDLGEAADLAARVARAGKVLCIAYNTPCTAELYTLRQMIRREDLGRLKLVSMHLSQPWYTNTLGQWRQDPSRSGGGQLYDSGAHPLCSLCWTVDDQVAEVSAYIDRLDAPVDINGVVNVKFANGVLASVAIAGEGPVSSYGTWIFETGRVELNPWHAQQIRVWRITPAHRNGVEDKYPQVEGSDREPLGNFIDAILGRDEPRTTPRVGLIQSQLMDAIYESERTGSAARPRTVSPPPTIPSTPHGS